MLSRCPANKACLQGATALFMKQKQEKGDKVGRCKFDFTDTVGGEVAD